MADPFLLLMGLLLPPLVIAAAVRQLRKPPRPRPVVRAVLAFVIVISALVLALMLLAVLQAAG